MYGNIMRSSFGTPVNRNGELRGGIFAIFSPTQFVKAAKYFINVSTFISEYFEYGVTPFLT